MTTLVPTLPLAGVKLMTVGVTLKVLELVTEPPLVAIAILPVLQAVGIFTDTPLSLVTVKLVAFTPPMVTFVV